MGQTKRKVYHIDGIRAGYESAGKKTCIPFVSPGPVRVYVGRGKIPVAGRKIQVLKANSPTVKPWARYKEVHRDNVLCIGRPGNYYPVPYRGTLGKCPDCQVIGGACLDKECRQHQGQGKQIPESLHR